MPVTRQKPERKSLRLCLGARLESLYKGKATNRSWTVGWHGKLWQPRYFDHIVRADEDLRAIAGYILNNSVRKGLVECAEDWPWSGNMNSLSL